MSKLNFEPADLYFKLTDNCVTDGLSSCTVVDILICRFLTQKSQSPTFLKASLFALSVHPHKVAKVTSNITALRDTLVKITFSNVSGNCKKKQ